jgi:hypothetical protein
MAAYYLICDLQCKRAHLHEIFPLHRSADVELFQSMDRGETMTELLDEL